MKSCLKKTGLFVAKTAFWILMAIIIIPFASLGFAILVGLFVIIYYALYYILIELSGFDKAVLVPAVAAAGLVFAYWFSNWTKAYYDLKMSVRSKKREMYVIVMKMLVECYDEISPDTGKFSNNSVAKLSEAWQVLALYADNKTLKAFESVSSGSNINSDEYLDSVRRFLILLRSEVSNGDSEELSTEIISTIIKKSQSRSI